MEGVRGVQAARGDAPCRQLGSHRVDRGQAAGDDAEVGPVDRRQRQLAAQEGEDLGLGQRHGEHRAGRHLLHQAAALDDQRESVFEAEDPGQAGGHVLPDRMPEQSGRTHAPGEPELRRCPRQHEEGGLGDLRPPQALRVVAAAAAPHRGAQVEGQQLAAAIDGGAEGRLAVVEAASHARVLRPLAREQEGHRVLARRGGRGEDALGIEAPQRAGGCRQVAAEQGPAMLESLAAGLQGVGDAAERQLRPLGEVLGEPEARVIEGGGALGRQRQQLPGAGGRRGRRRLLPGRLLEHHVGVGAAHAE